LTFQPPLPVEKTKAMGKIGVGVFNKVETAKGREGRRKGGRVGGREGGRGERERNTVGL
jgi:hypothetical protein